MSDNIQSQHLGYNTNPIKVEKFGEKKESGLILVDDDQLSCEVQAKISSANSDREIQAIIIEAEKENEKISDNKSGEISPRPLSQRSDRLIQTFDLKLDEES